MTPSNGECGDIPLDLLSAVALQLRIRFAEVSTTFEVALVWQRSRVAGAFSSRAALICRSGSPSCSGTAWTVGPGCMREKNARYSFPSSTTHHHHFPPPPPPTTLPPTQQHKTLQPKLRSTLHNWPFSWAEPFSVRAGQPLPHCCNCTWKGASPSLTHFMWSLDRSPLLRRLSSTNLANPAHTRRNELPHAPQLTQQLTANPANAVGKTCAIRNGSRVQCRLLCIPKNRVESRRVE